MNRWLIGLFLWVSYIAVAQENRVVQKGEVGIPDTIDKAISEITVRAPIRISSVQKWPGSVTVLDSLRLQTGKAYQVSELMNTIPGVLMQQGTLSTNRITIRGIGSRTPYNSNRIKAYWGEMPLTDGDGVTSIEDIGLNDIQQIQVLKGPASALYGAGLGGVILLNPWESTKASYTLKANSEAGSYRTFSNQLNLQLKHPKGKTWLVANSLNTNGYRENSHFQRYNVTLKGKYQTGRHYWYYLYNYRYMDGQIPSSLDSIDFENKPQKAADTWQAIGGYERSSRHLIQVGLRSPLNAHLIHDLTVFGGSTALDELRPFNRLDESKVAWGLRDKVTYSSQILRAEVGIEGMLEHNQISLMGVKASNHGELLHQSKITRSYLNFFGLVEYTIKSKLILQAAITVNETVYKAQEEYPASTETEHHYPVVVSPRLGFNYRLSAVSNFYASAGHGFSTPSVEEAQMPDGSFNAHIKPEEGVNVEVGYRFSSTSQKTHADVTFYRMQMKNLLVTKRESEEIFYGINAGKTNHTGIEAYLRQHIDFNWTNSSVDLSLSYFQSINTFDEFIDDGNDYHGCHLPGIPAFNGSFNVQFNISDYHLWISYKLAGGQYLTDDNSRKQEGFSKADAKISRDFTVGSFHGSLYLGANNLFDTHYASMVLINAPSFGNQLPRYYYPGLPFNVYGGVSIRF